MEPVTPCDQTVLLLGNIIEADETNEAKRSESVLEERIVILMQRGLAATYTRFYTIRSDLVDSDRNNNANLIALVGSEYCQLRLDSHIPVPRPPGLAHPLLPGPSTPILSGPASQATNVYAAPRPSQRRAASSWKRSQHGCISVFQGQAGLKSQQWQAQNKDADASPFKNRLLHMQTATQEVRRGLAHVHRLQAPGFAVRV